jgi:large subunit ribosomal protein L40
MEVNTPARDSETFTTIFILAFHAVSFLTMLRLNITSAIRSRVPSLALGRPLASVSSVYSLPTSLLGQTRGKRTGKTAGKTPAASRIITQLSVFTARKKLPRRLKLSVEDLIRHNTVQAAWKYFMRDKQRARKAQLKAQYEKMQEACNELEQVDKYLAFHATAREKGKRFTPEIRIPTDTPPKQIWSFGWKPSDITVVRKRI